MELLPHACGRLLWWHGGGETGIPEDILYMVPPIILRSKFKIFKVKI